MSAEKIQVRERDARYAELTAIAERKAKDDRSRALQTGSRMSIGLVHGYYCSSRRMALSWTWAQFRRTCATSLS